MHEISDSDGQDSGGGFENENPAPGGPDAQSRAYRLIQRANTKITLYSVLKNYGIQIPRNYNQKWVQIKCPFLSHKGSKERTPSFGYNFTSDYFRCFGCNKSGKSVEFISEMEGKKRTFVAQSIIDRYGDAELKDEDFEEPDDSKIEKILFETAKIFREFYTLNTDPNKIKVLEKIIWYFDSYLVQKIGAKNNAAVSNLDVEHLKARSMKVKELLGQLSE